MLVGREAGGEIPPVLINSAYKSNHFEVLEKNIVSIITLWVAGDSNWLKQKVNLLAYITLKLRLRSGSAQASTSGSNDITCPGF